MTQGRSVKRGYKSGGKGGVWSTERFGRSLKGLLFPCSATAALYWAAGAARRSKKRSKTSALGKRWGVCSWFEAPSAVNAAGLSRWERSAGWCGLLGLPASGVGPGGFPLGLRSGTASPPLCPVVIQRS